MATLNGRYRYAFTFYGDDGETAPGPLTPEQQASSEKIYVTVPQGSSGTTGRRVYRKKVTADGSTISGLGLVADIPDNITHALIDDTADDDVGRQPPRRNGTFKRETIFETPVERWSHPLPLARPDGSIQEEIYEFELYWNGSSEQFALSVGKDGEWIASEVPVLFGEDLLAQYQDEPELRGIHIIPMSEFGEEVEITPETLGRDVQLLAAQTPEFDSDDVAQNFHQRMLSSHPTGIAITDAPGSFDA